MKPILTLFVAGCATIGFIQPALGQLQTNIIATGLDRPLFVTAPQGDPRLFIVEQGGRIKVMQNGNLLPTPFLDLSNSVNIEGERGLLGMAFDPNFASNGRFYVDYIDRDNLDTVVATYQVNAAQPNVADASSRQQILTVDQPEFRNHKAGWIGFRPGETHNLYIATGDGGSANDPGNRAQNLSENLGKILRVDVSSDQHPNDDSQYGYTIPAGNMENANPEIFAYGLRNPYRNSFDSETGTFYIGDVGQNNREEIDIGAAGANYGWRKFEGTDLNFPGDADIADHTPPLHEYSHTDAGGSVIGGYVYRGSAIDGLEGTYFFADFVTDKVMSFRYIENAGMTELTDRTAELLSPIGISGGITSFGEDGFGNLYLVSINGQVGMIAAIPEPHTWAMMFAGLGLVGMWMRRKKSRSAIEDGLVYAFGRYSGSSCAVYADLGFNPRPALWPGATMVSGSCRRRSICFNPRPALWPGATRHEQVLRRGREVSILARRFGRALRRHKGVFGRR